MSSNQSQNPNIISLPSSPGWFAEYDPATNTTQIKKSSTPPQQEQVLLETYLNAMDIRDRARDQLEKIGVSPEIFNIMEASKDMTFEEWKAAYVSYKKL